MFKFIRKYILIQKRANPHYTEKRVNPHYMAEFRGETEVNQWDTVCIDVPAEVWYKINDYCTLEKSRYVIHNDGCVKLISPDCEDGESYELHLIPAQ